MPIPPSKMPNAQWYNYSKTRILSQVKSPNSFKVHVRRDSSVVVLVLLVMCTNGNSL